MRLGWYISGAGHAGLLALVLFGGIFARDRIPDVTVSDVSIISEAEFAALTAPEAAPEIETESPVVTPPAEDSAPETPEPDAAPDVATPEVVEAPDAPEDVPETLPEPLPEAALVEDNAPVIDTPETDIDGASPVAEATPAPAPRVAPVPSIAPPPEAEQAPEVVEDTTPVPEPEAEPAPEDDPQAPEEASDRIVTEAEETPDTAPATSARPRARPARPVRVAEPEETPAPASDSTADAVAAAVAEANRPANAPVGPPLTGGEKDAFRIAVGQCWVVDPGARSAGVIVTVGFSLDQTGRVQGDVRQISASGGDAGTQRAAFDAARRAILRCQKSGYDLPAEKYGQWRDIEMTFNPEGMQFR